MKTLLTSLITLTLTVSFAQQKVYNENGGKFKTQRTEEILTLEANSTTKIDRSTNGFIISDIDPWSEDSLFADSLKMVGIPEVLAGIPDFAITVVKEVLSVAHTITVSSLEKRIKKFSSEYERSVSNLDAGSETIPNINFQRKYMIEGSSISSNGLNIELEAHEVAGLDYFYYSVNSIDLNHSMAKTTKKSHCLDYSIVIQATFLNDTTVKTITTEPIQILSVDFGKNNFSPTQYPSDLIPIPTDSYLLKVGVKIIETNPREVNAQELLDSWKKLKEDNGESFETILRSILGTKEEES